DVRRALGDGAGTPRYIETVGREGYRFIAPLSAPPPVVRPSSGVSHDQAQTAPPHSGSENRRPETPLVGRDVELRQLHLLLSKALRGERQLVFVTGEAGIGKTTLIDAFLTSLASRAQDSAPTGPRLAAPVRSLDPGRQTLDAHLWLGRGQCLEQ